MTQARIQSTPFFDNEYVGLMHVTMLSIPRAVKLREVLTDRNGDAFFVTEYALFLVLVQPFRRICMVVTR